MRFICNRALLTEAVLNVSRVIPSKSSIPALEGIRIKAEGDCLALTGYDMEAGITTTIPADIADPGDIVLSARLFADMLRKMAGETVSVSVGDKYLTEICCGMTQFTILGMPADEFPELPQIEDGSGIVLEQESLKSMIDQTLFAVAMTDAKPIHTGSLFDLKDNTLNVVSVDGYRLALRSEHTGTDDVLSFVVPGKVLSELSKLLRDDAETPAMLDVSQHHIVFRIGDYSVVSRLLEGEFLDYRASIPAGCTTTAKVSTREFIESIERVSLLISDRLRSPLRILFDENKIKISCSTSLGRSYDELDCVLNGPAVEMGFNNKYLLDALKASASDEVLLEISGPLSPIKVLPPEGSDYLFLVLPVRLKNEA